MTTTTLSKPPPTGAMSPVASIRFAELTTSASEAQMASDELTPSDVAREFNVSPTTVRRWDKRGWLKPTHLLPGSRHRRYSRADVEAFKKRVAEGAFDETSTQPSSDE
jgi:hypothetical protein